MSLACGCDDRPDIDWNEWFTANKEHRCNECRKIIQPGEYYCRNTAVWENRFMHEINCEKCQDLAESLWAMGFCIIVGELHEAYQEYLNEYNPPKL